MSPDTVDKIQEALEPLAELAEQGASFSWEVLVRQIIITGSIQVVVGILMLVATIILARLCARNTQKYRSFTDYERHDNEDVGFIAFISGAVATLGLIASMAFLTEGLPRLLNPGYYALKEIASMVGLN